MATGESKRVTIAISQRTKDGLDAVKHPGQTYDGVIQELIKRSKKPPYKYGSIDLPEFRDYARHKYPDVLDEDLITMIEDLIERGAEIKRCLPNIVILEVTSWK